MHTDEKHSLKRAFASLILSFLFLLQTTLHAYTPQHILLQSVTGKVNNLQVQSASVVLESLNNISHHETTKTSNALLTTTTTMQGSNVETIAGTNIIVGGTFSINGDDLTHELYDGVLTSQATREDPAKAQEAITQALNAGIQNYLESANTQEESTPPYSGYSSTAISTIQTTAVSEHWDESTTSLNALGQLVVQAVVAVATAGAGNTILAGTTAAGNTIVTAAVQSVVNQVSTELLTAVITGEGVNLDLGNLVTGAVKAAVFAGVTDAIDTELFADTEGNILPREELSFTQNVSKEVLHASASTAIYGGDFKDNVIAAVGDAVAAPAFEYVGHTLTNTDGLNLDPNDLSTQALITTSHALVGGTIAELSGGEFSSGAVATAVGHVVGEYVLKGGYADSAIRGELSTEDAKLQIETISQAVAGATILLTQENVSQEELDRATSMATSVVENNSLKDFDAYVAFGKSIFTGAGEQVWEDVKSLAGALASPKETYNALKELVTSPEAIAQLGEDTYKEITDKLDYIGEVLLSDTEYGNTEASLAGAKTGEILLLVAESVGGIKGLTTGAKAVKGTSVSRSVSDISRTLEGDGKVGHNVDLHNKINDRKLTLNLPKGYKKNKDGNIITPEGEVLTKGTFTTPSGRTYDHYGREIDMDLEFEVKNQKTGTITKYTNKEWMEKGRNPYVLDKNGIPVPTNQHHIDQRASGPIVEMPAKEHQTNNKEYHPFGKNKNPNDPVDHVNEWNNDRININQQRLDALKTLEKERR